MESLMKREEGERRGRKRQREAERIFWEIMAENFINDTKHEYIQESQQTSGMLNSKEIHTKTHYNQIVKHQRQRILKTAREKHIITNKWFPIKLSVDSSSETMESRRQQADKVLTEKNQEFYIQQNCLSKWEKIKTFPEKRKLKEFISTTSLTQKEMLKGVLQGKMRGHQTVIQSHMEK